MDGAEVDEEGVAWVRFGEVPVGERGVGALVLRSESIVDLSIRFSGPEAPFWSEKARR